MKGLGGFVFAILLAIMAGLYIQERRHWYVRPAPNGKWRSCLKEGTGISCGSPVSYDEAMWWSETNGGQKVDQ